MLVSDEHPTAKLANRIGLGRRMLCGALAGSACVRRPRPQSPAGHRGRPSRRACGWVGGRPAASELSRAGAHPERAGPCSSRRGHQGVAGRTGHAQRAGLSGRRSDGAVARVPIHSAHSTGESPPAGGWDSSDRLDAVGRADGPNTPGRDSGVLAATSRRLVASERFGEGHRALRGPAQALPACDPRACRESPTGGGTTFSSRHSVWGWGRAVGPHRAQTPGGLANGSRWVREWTALSTSNRDCPTDGAAPRLAPLSSTSEQTSRRSWNAAAPREDPDGGVAGVRATQPRPLSGN